VRHDDDDGDDQIEIAVQITEGAFYHGKQGGSGFSDLSKEVTRSLRVDFFFYFALSDQ
jgi:hypothetical protein